MRLDCPERAYLPVQRFAYGAKYPWRRFDKRARFRKRRGHRIPYRETLNFPFQFGYGLPETEKFLLVAQPVPPSSAIRRYHNDLCFKPRWLTVM